MKGDWQNTILLGILSFLAIYPLWRDDVNYLYAVLAHHKSVADIIIAAIGSAGGAVGAAIAIESVSRRKEAVSRLNNLNAATMITYHVFTTLYQLNKEQIQAVLTNHENCVKEFSTKIVKTAPDLASFTFSPLNIEGLDKILSEKVFTNSKTFMAYSELRLQLTMLTNSMLLRNEMLEKWKNAYGSDLRKIIPLFLGVIDEKGGDGTYPVNLENIAQHIRYSLFLSKQLVMQLMELAQITANELKLDAAVQAYFEHFEQDFLPHPHEFAAWENQFLVRPRR